jgi:hypothetical protein
LYVMMDMFDKFSCSRNIHQKHPILSWLALGSYSKINKEQDNLLCFVAVVLLHPSLPSFLPAIWDLKFKPSNSIRFLFLFSFFFISSNLC